MYRPPREFEIIIPIVFPPKHTQDPWVRAPVECRSSLRDSACILERSELETESTLHFRPFRGDVDDLFEEGFVDFGAGFRLEGAFDVCWETFEGFLGIGRLVTRIFTFKGRKAYTRRIKLFIWDFSGQISDWFYIPAVSIVL
jgi:hypothetical protein